MLCRNSSGIITKYYIFINFGATKIYTVKAMLNKLGITGFEKITYSAILILLAIVTFMYYYYPDELWGAVQEDAVFENLTILFLTVCLIICILNAKNLACKKKYAGMATYLLLSLMLVFVIGEELSWGQRIFNIQSGVFFMEKNTQSETNLHNLRLGDVRINKLIFTQISTVLLAVYFLLSRVACRIKIFGKIHKKFCIPLPKLHHTIFFYFAFLMVYAFDYKRNNEVMELIFPMMFMLIFLNPYQPEIKKPAV